MRMTRLIALAVPITFLLLNVAMPVSATKPDVSVTITNDFEGTYIDCSAVKPEWNFQVRFRADDVWIQTTHYDNKGDVAWILFKEHWDATVWNSASGLSVTDNADWHETYYPATNTWVVDGHLYHWSVAGRGLILVESGHSVYYWDDAHDLWLPIEHGRPHDLTSVYWLDYKPMCAALA